MYFLDHYYAWHCCQDASRIRKKSLGTGRRYKMILPNGLKMLNSAFIFTGVYILYQPITVSGIPGTCISPGVKPTNTTWSTTGHSANLVTRILCQCSRPKTLTPMPG